MQLKLDFTINTYLQLLDKLHKNHTFLTFEEIIRNNGNCSFICLRHDVDTNPENSLLFARIQHKLGIKASYYFRIIPKSFKKEIIQEIANLGHEIGYHYEDMDLANKILKQVDTNFNQEKLVIVAFKLFKEHLDLLREIFPVKTICMHGSPLSKYDNKLIWKYFDYRQLGIIGEPYFDLSSDEVFYLTDTGRRWDGADFSIRDKMSVENEKFAYLKFHTTNDIIKAVEKGTFPDKVMMTFHPQRWTNQPVLWLKELILQNIKNQIKQSLIKNKD
jgi:hypothetical protein